MSDEKKELDNLLEAANGKKDTKSKLGFKFISEDDKIYVDSNNFDWSDVEAEVAKQLEHINMLDLYGKKAQMANSYGSLKAKKWINYTKNKIYQADPRASTVKVHIDSPMFGVRFGLVLNDGFHVLTTVTEELLYHALQEKGESTLLKLTDNLVNDIKETLKKEHPVPKIVNTNKPNYELLYNNISNGIQNKIEDLKPILNDEEWANLLKKTATEEAKKWWGNASWEQDPPLQNLPPQPTKPFIPKPPTPPKEDPKFDVGPELAYNKAITAMTKLGSKHKSHYQTWGSTKEKILEEIKLQNKILQEAYAKKKSHTPVVHKGFDGERVQDNLKDVLPCLYQTVKCPKCLYEQDMASQIIHLNDEHDWTREAIADWAESLDIDISVKEKEDNE